MSAGRVLGGSGEAWLRDVVSHPAARVATTVSDQMERLGGDAYAVLIHPALARETLQQDAHRGDGYPPIHGLPVYRCYEVAGPVVVTKWLFNVITSDGTNSVVF